MSKIAICFSGLPRLSQLTVTKWQQFISEYDIDVFVHTWHEPETVRSQTVSYIAEAFKPKQLVIENSKQFNTARYNERIWPYKSQPKNVLSLWYSVKQSIELALNWDQYDIICRARFDWWCESIVLNKFDGLTVPDDPGLCNHHFTYKNKRYLAHNDQFGYGPPDVMKIYGSTVDRIPWLYSDDGVDFCNELFLTATLISNNVPIFYQQNMNYRIVK